MVHYLSGAFIFYFIYIFLTKESEITLLLHKVSKKFYSYIIRIPLKKDEVKKFTFSLRTYIDKGLIKPCPKCHKMIHHKTCRNL